MAEKIHIPRERNVCVFCGSALGARKSYQEVASAVGHALAQAGYGLVFGGGHVGLMGILANAALAEGAPVLGVIPRALEEREVAHQGLTRLEVVETMHERKAMMVSESHAFVALPGGFGTLDEFFEVLTWSQLGIHPHPCILLNTDGYFDPLLAFVDASVREGFVKPENRRLIQVVNSPEEVVPQLRALWRRTGKPSSGMEVPVP